MFICGICSFNKLKHPRFFFESRFVFFLRFWSFKTGILWILRIPSNRWGESSWTHPSSAGWKPMGQGLSPPPPRPQGVKTWWHNRGGAEGPWGVGGLGGWDFVVRDPILVGKNISPMLSLGKPRSSQRFFGKNDERGCNFILPKVSLKWKYMFFFDMYTCNDNCVRPPCFHFVLVLILFYFLRNWMNAQNIHRYVL